MNSKGKGVIAGAVVICIILFIGMCLFISAFSIVEPTYMAIARNKINGRIEENKVYFEGRHFLGVSNEFIYYPMAWQLIEYTDDNTDTGSVNYICKQDDPLSAFTNEGLTVSVEVSLYFTIPPQQLVNFYTDYNVNFQDSLANECTKALKDSVTKFKYDELFKGRLNISQAMTEDVTYSLAKRRCVLQKLLLRGLGFSDSLEKKIEESVITDQAKTQNEYRSQINKISAEIDTLRKNYTFQINEIVSAAKKNATLIVEQARANANSLMASSTAKAWQNYQEATELEPEDLLRVQWARSLGSSSSSDNLVLGYDKIGSRFVQKIEVAH